MIPKKLPEKVWKDCVNSMPIFGIDIIIFSQKNNILMGRRNNNPAKGKLFVPGGRVLKNERIIDAFNRILLIETGLNYSFNKSISIGLYEHFYDVTNWSSSQCSTHYIIEARLIEIETENINIKINQQHSKFEWINIEDLYSEEIHYYSKVYINKIKKLTNK